MDTTRYGWQTEAVNVFKTSVVFAPRYQSR